MVKSYRGQEVDLNKIIKSQGDNMSLGNTHLNGRGDIIKNGKVVKTRAERLEEWMRSHKSESTSVNMANDGKLEGFEEEIARVNAFEDKKVAKPKKNIEQNIEENIEEKVEE